MVRPKHYPYYSSISIIIIVIIIIIIIVIIIKYYPYYFSILPKVLHKTFGGIPKRLHQLFGAVFVPWNDFVRVWTPIDDRRQRCIYICVR